MNDGFNPKNLDQPVDLFAGGVFQAFREHLNRLVARVNYLGTLLKPDRAGAGASVGQPQVVVCNINGQPGYMRVYAAGKPVIIGNYDLTPGTGSFQSSA
jgi:hypothetical protein